MMRCFSLLSVLCVAVLLSAVSTADNGDGGPAQYSAVQKDKTVTVTAKGENNTGGWSNQLTVVADTNPPEFKFTQKKTEGPSTQAFSRFSVKATVDAPTKLDHVFVTDVKGKHKVAVKQE